MARTRSTFRLDSDVREYLEHASENYKGVNMTSAIHIIIRHCMEEGVLDDLLRQTSVDRPKENDEDTSESSATAEDTTEVDNENPTMGSEEKPDGGVSFSDMARDSEEEVEAKNDGARRPDEGDHDGNGSSEENTERKPRSAASSLRQKFRS